MLKTLKLVVTLFSDDPLWYFFQGEKETQTVQVWSHRINQINALYTAFVRGVFFRKNERNNSEIKKELQETSIFCGTKKKRFCFHVCFNPELAAKQQHFHCFLAQCLMRGCQLTEVFLVSEQRWDFIKIFFSCVSVCLHILQSPTTRSEVRIVLYILSYSNVRACWGKRLWQLARQTINCYNWDETTFIK